VVAGAAQVVTGEQTHSRLEKIVGGTAEAAGVSPQKAEVIGSVVDAVTGLALTAGVGSGQALTRAVATEVEVTKTFAKEVEVGTVVAKAAGGGKVLLAAEDCNAASLKRLFDSLPKKADNGTIGYVKTESEISEIWTQLEKTGVAEVIPFLVQHCAVPTSQGVTAFRMTAALPSPGERSKVACSLTPPTIPARRRWTSKRTSLPAAWMPPPVVAAS
jgi:hypothetical protein